MKLGTLVHFSTFIVISSVVVPAAAQESNVSSERETRGAGHVDGNVSTETEGTVRTEADTGPRARPTDEGAHPDTIPPTESEGREATKNRESLDQPIPPIPIEAPKRLDGIAEVGLGWLLLPNATVCGEAGCSKGDTAPTVDIWNLVRLPNGLAFGAGIALGLVPTADVPQDNPPGIKRDHTRGYMTIEGLFRYYPFRQKTLEGWVGIGPGVVIVSDTFSSREGIGENAYVGNPGVTLFTEGLSVIAALGGNLELTEHWYLGATVRGGVWRLPDTPTKSPLGDEASLTGTNTVAYVSVNIAFRSQL